MANEDLLSRIAVDPDICHGKPCLRGLRYPVETMLEYLAGGDSVEDLLAEFPDLERERYSRPPGVFERQIDGFSDAVLDFRP